LRGRYQALSKPGKPLGFINKLQPISMGV